MRHLLGLALVLAAFALPAPLAAQQVQVLTGRAHNVTVGARDDVTLQIAFKSDGSFELTGHFGLNDLAGDVAAIGSLPRADDGALACFPRHECLIFAGTIALDERAGFPNGTITDFTLHLDIDANAGSTTGVYHIGPLPGFHFEQYGIVTFTDPIS